MSKVLRTVAEVEAAFAKTPFRMRGAAVLDFADNVFVNEGFPFKSKMAVLEKMGYTVDIELADFLTFAAEPKCPRCTSLKLKWIDSDYLSDAVAIEKGCQHCGLRYFEYYRLSSYEVLGGA